jgi:Lon protease-like protein
VSSPERQVIPLFPLGLVLVPGRPLPLHIFEPRYRQLVLDVTGRVDADGAGGAFGVVLGMSSTIDEGTGRPRGDGRTATFSVNDVGTLAEILQTRPHPDGRFDLLTVGTRRFQIMGIDSARMPYLEADVEFLPEPDGVPPTDLLSTARRLGDDYSRLLADLTGADEDVEPIADEPMRASYEIAARLQLGNTERQRLLAAASSAERLTAEVTLLRREVTMLRETRTVAISTMALYVPSSRN